MAELFPRGTEKLDSWAFTGVFGRTFLRLFDLQMWCFGCDIKRVEGNLLLESGFTRTRPHAEIGGSTYYKKTFDSDKSIHLWGFAVVVSTDNLGSLCLRRYDQSPSYLADKKIEGEFWRPHELPKFKAPVSKGEIQNAQQLLKICADELVRYENTVSQSAEPSYRPSCVKTRRKERKTLKHTTLSNGWAELSKAVTICQSSRGTVASS